MKYLIYIAALVLAVTGSVSASIPSEPNSTLLWNRFTAVTVVDSFAVATGENGLMVLKRSPGESHYRQGDHLFLGRRGNRPQTPGFGARGPD